MTNRNSDAILLLTAQFSDTATSTPKPLEMDEWHKISVLLEKNKSRNLVPKCPQDFFNMSEETLELVETETGISKERISNLLDRGSGMAIMRAKWESAGLWCLTVEDKEYPEVWKKSSSLVSSIPPIIYGSGNKNVLTEELIGMLGDLSKYPKNLASYLGSKGVITVAPVSSESPSTNLPTIGIIQTNLLQEATAIRFRSLIQDEKLTLISFYSPEVVINNSEKANALDLFKSLTNRFIKMQTGSPEKFLPNTWTYVRGFINQEGRYINLQNCALLTSADENQEDSNNSSPIPRINVSDKLEEKTQDRKVYVNKEVLNINTETEVFKQNTQTNKEEGTDNQHSKKIVCENQYTEESGNLLPAELMPSSVLKVQGIDKFSKFLLGYLEHKTSLKNFQSEASSEFLTKSALSKWLKKAVQEGIVKEIKVNRRKFYQRNC